MHKKLSIVLLIGNSWLNKNTASLFMKSGLNVKGVVICDKKVGGIHFNYLKISYQKYGFSKLFGQIMGRLFYNIFNSRKDSYIQSKLINKGNIESSMEEKESLIIRTTDYESVESLAFIRNANPDLIVIHTPYWVSKKVRSIPKFGVIGGHPGITPFYRGLHSSFWTLYNGDPDRLGYTVFWVDAGVDTGDIIFQDLIKIDNADSYVTAGWKGMIQTSKMQIDIIKNYELGIDIPRIKIDVIPDGTNYGQPTLLNYVLYRHKQSILR